MNRRSFIRSVAVVAAAVASGKIATEKGAQSFQLINPEIRSGRTFYRIATAKGQVVIRFYGSSNGYYSESVSFAQLT